VKSIALQWTNVLSPMSSESSAWSHGLQLAADFLQTNQPIFSRPLNELQHARSSLIRSTNGSRLRRAGGAAHQHLKLPRGAFMQLGGVRRERQSRRHPPAFERVE
jgi:hypothetical protein